MDEENNAREYDVVHDKVCNPMSEYLSNVIFIGHVALISSFPSQSTPFIPAI
jgi:hypothetical protein